MLPLFDGLKSFSHFSSRTVFSRRRCLRDQTRTSLNVKRNSSILGFVERSGDTFSEMCDFVKTKAHWNFSMLFSKILDQKVPSGEITGIRPISHLSMTFQMSEQNWPSRTCPNIRNN